MESKDCFSRNKRCRKFTVPQIDLNRLDEREKNRVGLGSGES